MRGPITRAANALARRSPLSASLAASSGEIDANRADRAHRRRARRLAALALRARYARRLCCNSIPTTNSHWKWTDEWGPVIWTQSESEKF